MMENTRVCTEAKTMLELLTVSEMHHRPGSQIYAHARKSFGLIYVLTGSAVYEFDGVPYPVKAGDLFCIPQKVPFSLRPVKNSTYSTRQFGLMIYEDDLRMRMMSLYRPLTVDATLRSMLDYIFRFWTVPAGENQSLLQVFIRAILAQFFVGELDYGDPVSAYVLTEGCSPATRSVLCYVEANRYKRFSLEEMGRALGYNKHYLCSAFSRDTGISIVKYVHFLKIRQAVVHFFYWGTGLTEVCTLLGYDSMSHFSILFKSVVGLSPGAFRTACLTIDADERTVINCSTILFVSRPVPMEQLFGSMRQLGETMAGVLRRSCER